MDDIGEWLIESIVGRLLLLGALVLLLRLPIVRISGLIEQRQQNREEAVADVEQSWGGPHTVMGPVLVVPYHESAVKRGEATLRPRSVAIEGRQSSIVRRFLYVLLALQDFSLLVGSIGLFVVLAGTMFLTRDVDWYGLPRVPPPKVHARGRPAHERST